MYNSKHKRSDKRIRLRKNVFGSSILERSKYMIMWPKVWGYSIHECCGQCGVGHDMFEVIQCSRREHGEWIDSYMSNAEKTSQGFDKMVIYNGT